jgi:hypothetical protein
MSSSVTVPVLGISRNLPDERRRVLEQRHRPVINLGDSVGQDGDLPDGLGPAPNKDGSA